MGCFLVDGPADDLQHGGRVKILPHQSGKHQREQDLGKFFNRERLGKCILADLDIVLQHGAQGPQNVLPHFLHLLLAIGGILPDKAQSMMGEKVRIPLTAVFQLLIHPSDAGQGIAKDDLILRVVEDACIQMELTGHDFFVFRNAETDEVNVVYKRKGNTYGLIEPEC